MFDIFVNTTFAGMTQFFPVATSGGAFRQLTFANNSAPTLPEVERIFRERWHTEPGWVTRGEAAPNGVIGPGNFPAGFTYNAGAQTVTLPAGATFDGDIEGYDFGDHGLNIQGVVTGSIQNNRWLQTQFTKTEVGNGASSGALAVVRNEPITIDTHLSSVQPVVAGGIRRNLFIGSGIGSGAAAILGRPPTSGLYANVGPIEFNSFQRFGQDIVKATWGGILRGNYFDAQICLPDWAEQWQSGKTYVLGDVVYGAPGTTAARIRVCRVASTTSTPNFSGNTATTAWAWYDPHTDIETPFVGPQGQTLEHVGNVYNLNGPYRRWMSAEPLGIGQNSSIRLFPNTASQDMCSHDIHHNLFLDDDELKFDNAWHIGISAPSDFYGTETVQVRDNWYQTQSANTGLVQDAQAHVTVTNNTAGWLFPSAATLSDITAIHGRNTGTLAYEATPSKGGWFRVVVNASATPLTGVQFRAAQVGVGGVLAVFDFDAEAGQPALGFTNLNLTTGQAVRVHALYQAGGGVDTIAPVQTVTEGAGTANTFSHTVLAFDGYVFDRNGSDYCEVVYRGTGRAGDQVQVRGTSAGGNTAWTSGYVRSNGTWQVTALVPRSQWGNWYAPVARVGSNGTALTGSNTFGCGDVIGILGQSELQHWLDNKAFRNQLQRELFQENLSVVLSDDSVQPNIISTARVTTANMGGIAADGAANVGTLALANAYARVLPDRKVMLVDLADSGSDPFVLADDAQTDRQWSDLEAVLDTVRQSGSDLGAVFMYWVAAPRSSLDEMLDNWSPVMFGQLASGAAFTLGNVNTEAENSHNDNPIDRCFWDIEADPNERGRGVFARNRTKLYMNHLGIGNDLGNTTPAAAYELVTSGANQNVPSRMNTEVTAMRAFANDSRVQTFFGGWNGKMGLANFNENNTGTAAGYGDHPNRFSPFGTPLEPMAMLPGMLRHAGAAAPSEPKITGTQVINANTVDVLVDLPNGGNLTTLRELTSTAFTLTPRPAQQQVVTGFQVSRAAGTKRPIYRSAETSYPSLYRGTITIHDSGSGVAPNRVGKLRIVFDSPIATGDLITWADGLTSGMLAHGEKLAHIWMDYPIEHVPAWYDTAALYPYYGEPIVPQTPAMTLIV